MAARVVAPIKEYAVYYHYNHEGKLFFIGKGKNYEWRRYTNRPKEWMESLGGTHFSARVFVHDLDKKMATRVVNALVWYELNKGNVLINEVVEPKVNLNDEWFTYARGFYIKKLFRRNFRSSTLYLRINTTKRNFHKEFVAKKDNF